MWSRWALRLGFDLDVLIISPGVGRNSTLLSKGIFWLWYSSKRSGSICRSSLMIPESSDLGRPCHFTKDADNYYDRYWQLDHPGFARSSLFAQAICGHSRLGSLSNKESSSNASLGITVGSLYSVRSEVLKVELMLESGSNLSIESNFLNNFMLSSTLVLQILMAPDGGQFIRTKIPIKFFETFSRISLSFISITTHFDWMISKMLNSWIKNPQMHR